MNKEFVKLNEEQTNRSVVSRDIRHKWIMSSLDNWTYVFAPIAILAYEKHHSTRLTEKLIMEGFGYDAILGDGVGLNEWKDIAKTDVYFLKYKK